MISKVDCKHGMLYRITSRNLRYGVYNAETGEFVGIRRKWGDEYLSTEYHWDDGPPHGTARVARALEMCPCVPSVIVTVDGNRCENSALFEWLQTMQADYESRSEQNYD